MLLHHPFINDPKDTLLKDHVDWIAAYQSDCIDQGHLHLDSLPATCNETEEDLGSDSETVHNDDDDEQWRAEWMHEAGRHPNQHVEMDFKNLGAQDLDLQYDWIGKSPDQNLITTATKWLTEKIKESPNDDVQTLPEVDYWKLQGEQRNVFLQVMAYFKKTKTGDQNQPEPLRLNVDGAADSFPFAGGK